MKSKIIQCLRAIADGALNTNHFLDPCTRIDSIPILGTHEGDEASIQSTKSNLAFCREAPLIWDMMLNCVALAMSQDAVSDVGRHHYEVIVPIEFFNNYLTPIKDRKEKYETKTSISNTLFNRPVRILYRAQDGKLELCFPVIASLVDENQKNTNDGDRAIGIRFLLQKGVFAPMVTSD